MGSFQKYRQYAAVSLSQPPIKYDPGPIIKAPKLKKELRRRRRRELAKKQKKK